MSDSLRGKLTELIASGSEMVAFSDTFMGDEGCHVVNDMLRENKCVKSLDLRGCNIRADGAMALASLLTHNRTLTFLGLEWNGVGMLETGVQALCKALATNISITEVDLRNNSIGPSGGAAIGAMLSSNTTIRRLDLRWNNLGVNGGKTIAAAMEKNRHVFELEISGNKLTEDSIRQVDLLLRRNRGEAAGPASPTPATATAHIATSSAIVTTTASSPSAAAGTATSPLLQHDMDPSYERSKDRALLAAIARGGAGGGGSGGGGGGGGGYNNDALEQSLRAKLLELSQALLESKERSVAVERALTEEQRMRGDSEVRMRECESVIRELQSQIEANLQSMEGGQRSLNDQMQHERELRQQQERRNHELQSELQSLQQQLRDAIDKAGRLKQGSEIELDQVKKELGSTQQQLKDEQLQRAEERAGLLRSLSDAQEQRAASEHALRLAHQQAVAVKEQLLITASSLHNKQMKALEDQMHECQRARQQAEEQLRAALAANQDLKVQHEQHVLALEEQRRREEEGRLGLLDDKINSIQQARELQQQRAEQQVLEIQELRRLIFFFRQVLEIQELRRLENARLKDHDAFLKREAQLRMAAEKEAELRQNDVEAMKLELLQTRHKLVAAEASLARLEEHSRQKLASHETSLQEVLKEKSATARALEEQLSKAEARAAAAEVDARRKEAECARLREEELRRLAAVEERIVERVRKELLDMRQEAAGYAGKEAAGNAGREPPPR